MRSRRRRRSAHAGNCPSADKRFRRSHVRPTSRRDSWRGKVLRGLAVAGLVVLFASVLSGAVGYAVSSSSLTIRHIAVSGNQRLSSGQVQALLGHLIGSSTVAADIELARPATPGLEDGWTR